MKNIVIAQEQGKAVAVGSNMEPIKKIGSTNFTASLEVLKDILSNIPVEPNETTCIYLPDMLRGILTGSAVEYVKTGKTGTGAQLSKEDIEGFKTFYKMYAERILNVKFGSSKYIKKENAELIALRNNAWNTLKAYNAGAINSTNNVAIIDPDKNLREAIDKKIIEAIEVGNMDLVASLTAYKNTLRQPTAVGGTVTATEMMQIPSFESEEDKAFRQAEEEVSGEEMNADSDVEESAVNFEEGTTAEEQPIPW